MPSSHSHLSCVEAYIHPKWGGSSAIVLQVVCSAFKIQCVLQSALGNMIFYKYFTTQKDYTEYTIYYTSIQLELSLQLDT